MERFKQKLQAAAIPFRENEPLAAHCTFKIGGPAQLFVMPENEQQLCSAVALCKEQDVRYYLLGNGSNILFADEGFSGVVIDVSALDAEIAVEDTVLTAGAGVRLAALCKAALKHGLSGLEFAYGIPGTVGGAVYMNAGAYGGEMKDVLTTVRYLAAEGEVREVPAAELDLRYRHSIFEENSGCILSAQFHLQPGNAADIRAKMDELMDSLNAHLDVISERLITIGGEPYSTLVEFSSNSGLTETTGTFDKPMSDQIQLLVDTYKYLSVLFQVGLDITDEEGDAPSNDIFTAAKSEIDKTIWMLTAELGQAPGLR